MKLLHYLAAIILAVFLYQRYNETFSSSHMDRNYSLTSSGENVYKISLITVRNPSNAPFYYHTSLELAEPNKNIPHVRSYGLYPSFSTLPYNNWWVRLLRPIYPVPARIRNPDPLYLGDGRNVFKGTVIYREDYWVNSSQFAKIKVDIDNKKHLYYSYYGGTNSDNCSSWVRKLLNSNLNTEISCKRYPLSLLGYKFNVPVSLVDLPFLCKSNKQ